MSPKVPPICSSPPALHAQHDAIWSGISVWLVEIGCPRYILSQVLVQPQPSHWRGDVRCREVPDAGQAPLSNDRNLSILSTFFPVQIQTQSYTRLCEENCLRENLMKLTQSKILIVL